MMAFFASFLRENALKNPVFAIKWDVLRATTNSSRIRKIRYCSKPNEESETKTGDLK